MRAFAAWWNGNSTHVLCILAIYKKKSQESFWAELNGFDERAGSLLARLTQLYEQKELIDKLEIYEDRDDHRVIKP